MPVEVEDFVHSGTMAKVGWGDLARVRAERRNG